jgi:hypothetical protein
MIGKDRLKIYLYEGKEFIGAQISQNLPTSKLRLATKKEEQLMVLKIDYIRH